MKKLTPNLAVNNIRETIEYYQNNFGFEIAMAVSEDKSSMGAELVEDKEYVWAMIACGDVTLMLQRTDSYSEDVGVSVNELGASATLYMEVEDVDALYASVKNSVNIIKEIDTTWYGQREFYVRDCNGYILAFATMQQQG
ncbi:MAG: VOC family protein [Sulfurovaceae bacterium]|nr:VOC family protein [Sulfurovaceae bacterium]